MRLIIFLFFTSFVNAQTEEINKNPIPVTVNKLTEILVQRELSASAETISINHSSIASENNAVVKSVFFDVGEKVKQGQVLLELENTDFYLLLKQAQASLASIQVQIKQAQLRLKRAEDLIEKKYISDDDLLARHTELDVLVAEKRRLEISIEQSNRELSKTKIKAPFEAVVSQRSATVGSLVNKGQEMFKLVQIESPEVIAEIPQHIAKTLANSSNIKFMNHDESFAIQLKVLSPLVKSPTRTQVARFTFTNDFKSKIGSNGEVIWKVEKSLLPADLVVRRNKKLGVFIVNGDKARFVELKYAQEGRPVPVDLLGNTIVIIGGRERLQDGDLIKLN